METTELVHEAFLKLEKQHSINWQNRNQFYAITAQIIRRLLIDECRAQNSQKRGGVNIDLTIDRLSSIILGEIDVDFDLLEFDTLLKNLESLDQEAAKVVELKFFTGLTNEETSQVCNISITEVANNWKFARSWLLNQLTN